MEQINNTTEKLNILCVGAGAIGAYIGGSLALTGHNVGFIERPNILNILKENGLFLELNNGVHHLKNLTLYPSIAEACSNIKYNLTIVAVKSYDTDSILQLFKANSEIIPTVLCLQNGVENEPKFAGILGSNRVIAGTVTSAVGLPSIGHIILEKLRGIGISANHPLSQPITDAMNTAGLNAQLFSSAASMKWSKLITNLPANASSAILDMTAAQIFSDPRLFHLEMLQLREALNVVKKLNHQIVDLPKTPVRMFAFAIRGLPELLSRPLLMRAIATGRGEKMPSFHIDLHSGKGKSEVDFLNGAVVRFGENIGVLTPVNKILTDTLMDLATGNLPINTFSRQPEHYIDLFKNIAN